MEGSNVAGIYIYIDTLYIYIYIFILFQITRKQPFRFGCCLFIHFFGSQLKVRVLMRDLAFSGAFLKFWPPDSLRVPKVIQDGFLQCKHLSRLCVETILLRHHLFILQICLIVIYCLLNTFNELQQLRCSKICLGWGLVPLFTFHTSKLRQNNMSRPKEKSNESSRNMASGCFKQSYDQNIWR